MSLGVFLKRTGEAAVNVANVCTETNLRAIGTIAGLVITLGGVVYARDIETVVHSPTSQEQFIKDALEDTKLPGLPGALRLDCIDEGSTTTAGETTTALGLVPLPIIHLDKKQCNNMTSYANLADKSQASKDQAYALDVVAHEAAHVRFRSKDEAATECRAFQDVPKLAARLGATTTDIAKLKELGLYNYLNDEVYADGGRRQYFASTCRDGGPYDEDRARAGNFPFPHGDKISTGDAAGDSSISITPVG